MRLHLAVPGRVVFDGIITRLVFEGSAGHAGLLPRHADLVADVVPGLLRATHAEGVRLFAVDQGVLVKVGGDVRVLCSHAFPVATLEGAADVVAEHFGRLGEGEARARATLARLESDVIRQLARLRGDHGRA